MKASYLFKHNIDALLRGRGQTRHDLAMWCRRSDAWLSKILGKDDRNVPMKYLDRIADFFGIATYQLFQPGITPLTERRHLTRRSGRDRRISASVAVRAAADPMPSDDLALIREINGLTVDERRRVQAWVRVTRLGRSTEPEPEDPHDQRGTTPPPGKPARRNRRPPEGDT